jgi:hypothetical protein
LGRLVLTKTIYKRREKMKRLLIIVSVCVGIVACISLFSIYSLKPDNAFASDVLKCEEEIKNAYIEGFVDAIKFHSNQIDRFKKDDLALQKEAELSSVIYLNKIKKITR